PPPRRGALVPARLARRVAAHRLRARRPARGRRARPGVDARSTVGRSGHHVPRVGPPGPGRPDRRGDAVTPALELRSLTVDFGGLRAVDGLDLTAATGVVTGLIGP